MLLADRSRREAALLAALAPTALAFASGGAACAETEVSVTVLVNAWGEAPVEAALDALPAEHAEDASIDMRGPLPPLSFSAVRLVTVEARDLNRAWQLLRLTDRIDLASLHRQWRQCAAEVHPDRRPAKDAVTVSELTEAYRLLRPLLPTDASAKFQTLNSCCVMPARDWSFPMTLWRAWAFRMRCGRWRREQRLWSARGHAIRAIDGWL